MPVFNLVCRLLALYLGICASVLFAPAARIIETGNRHMHKRYSTAMILTLFTGFGTVLLTGCGGSDDGATAPVAELPSPVSVNNPLATQQQAIRDAAAVQEILREQAEAKKSAIRQVN
ncbi:MAG: hypothetical protein NWR09_08985 [Pseudomonadales bacterium]|nr:hypothetical protein [Pseudomonadales bacterium]MDP5058207.1 hypothetical protein [Pseudomonadales bacterium]